jgi:hypothetical protein
MRYTSILRYSHPANNDSPFPTGRGLFAFFLREYCAFVSGLFVTLKVGRVIGTKMWR